MKSFAVLVGVAVAVLAVGCGGQSDSRQDLSDAALAREYAQKVNGMSIDDAAAGKQAATEAAVDSAKQGCEVLRSMKSAGLISTDPSFPGNATALAAFEVKMAKSAASTAQQTQDSLLISAKYKCSEFSSMLRVYDAAH